MLDDDQYGGAENFSFDVLPTHLPVLDATTLFYNPTRTDDVQIKAKPAPKDTSLAGYIGRAGSILSRMLKPSDAQLSRERVKAQYGQEFVGDTLGL